MRRRVSVKRGCVYCGRSTDLDHVDQGPNPSSSIPVCKPCLKKIERNQDALAFDDLHFAHPSRLDDLVANDNATPWEAA